MKISSLLSDANSAASGNQKLYDDFITYVSDHGNYELFKSSVLNADKQRRTLEAVPHPEEEDQLRVLLNVLKNWSQCIPIEIKFSILHMSRLMQMSAEFNRPVVFVVKRFDVNIPPFAGLYFNNKLLFVDPQGKLPVKFEDSENFYNIIYELKKQNPELQKFRSKRLIWLDSIVESAAYPIFCGPIIVELLINIMTNLTLQHLEDYLNNLNTEWVDINTLLPESLVELSNELDKRGFENKVVGIKLAHLKLLSAAPEEKKTTDIVSEFHRSAAQRVFDYLVGMEGNKAREYFIREYYNKLALEIGSPSLRNHLPTSSGPEACDIENLPCLGSGHTSTVYRYDTRDQTFAIKVFKDNSNEQFKTEVNLLASLQHQNVIKYLSHGQLKNNLQFISLECAEWGELKQFIKSSEAFSPSWLIKKRFMVDIGLGLAYLHDTAGIIVRDLKSANVLVTWENGNLILKLSDFDLSIGVNTTSSTVVRAVGTPLYIAPEVYASYYPKLLPRHPDIIPSAPSFKSDVYSYGVICWEISLWTPVKAAQYKTEIAYVRDLLKGSRIEKADEIKEPKIASLVGQCWNNRHRERPSAQEMVQSLTQLT